MDRAIAHIACEIIWLKNLLLELGFRQPGPMPMFCDNQSAIYITQNPVFYERIKHIEVNCHLVRDFWTKKVVSLPFTPLQSRWWIFSSKQLHQRCFLSYVAS